MTRQSSPPASPRRRFWRSCCLSIPGLIGGSADLTGSNGTLTKLHTIVKANDFSGNYIHYGVREHGMAAAMNGLSLHGGIVPYGGTFLVFSDYCRPSIRLSALMGKRVIYVMTHDFIGLGEDGPTHQPVEQLAALRAMPNLYVFRPADSVECAECWEIALLAPRRRPRSSRSPARACRCSAPPTPRRICRAKGAYVLIEPEGRRDVTLIGTGSEVSLAVTAGKALQGQGIAAVVVSMPCWELFATKIKAIRMPSWAPFPAWASRRRSSSDGRNGLDRKAFSSACVDLGLQLRARSFISTSASRQWQSRPRPTT